MPIGLKGNSDGSGAIQIGGSDAISISTGLNTTFAGTITATGTVAGTTGTLYPLVSGTAVASTSGTAIDFTGIPSWVKRITVMFSGVSTNGTSQPMLQLGDSGGVETTGYATTTANLTTVANSATVYTNGWQLFVSNASRITQGNIVFSLLDASTNTWSGNGQFATTDVASIGWCSGTKSLSGTLDRVRITTANGTDAYDAGTINILFE